MYGSPDADDLPVSEDRAPAPVSPYGLSKYCAELYLELLRRDHGLNYTILRPANIYGPRQDPASEVGVVLIFLEQMLAGTTPQLRGFGKATRDYVYVKDLVSAILGAAKLGGPHPYHIGTAEEVNVQTIFDSLQQRLGSSFEPGAGTLDSRGSASGWRSTQAGRATIFTGCPATPWLRVWTRPSAGLWPGIPVS